MAEFKTFFEECSNLIEDSSVPGRLAELEQLRRLRSEQDIDHNPVANKFWHSRASVGISEQSFDLLTRFLHDHKFYNVLHILHDRLSVEVSICYQHTHTHTGLQVLCYLHQGAACLLACLFVFVFRLHFLFS